MKIGDKVECINTGRTGKIISDAFYEGKEYWDIDECKNYCMELAYMVDFFKGYGERISFVAYAEDLRLYEPAPVCEFMSVEVSIHAEQYWGMKGMVVELIGREALVKLYGYEKPIMFNAHDLEPLKDGTSLSCWLDTI